MSVSKGREVDSKKRKMFIRWGVYSIIYAIFYGILAGTFSYYYGNVPLFWILRMDIPGVFIMLGLAGWALLTFIIFEGKHFGLRG